MLLVKECFDLRRVQEYTHAGVEIQIIELFPVRGQNFLCGTKITER